MNNRHLKLAVAKMVLLVAFPALASGGEHGGGHEAGHHGSIDWYLLGGQIFTFFVFLGILYFALKSKVPQFFAARHETVKAAVEEAKKAKAEAEAKAREYDTKIRDLDQELAKLNRTLAEGAEAERSRLMQDAQDAAARIAKDAQAAIEVETERARLTLRAEAADLAVQMAADILKREIKADDHAKLVQSAAQSVAAKILNDAQRAASASPGASV